MVFASVEDLLLMGGHGFYVWLSYGAGVACLLALLALPLATRARLLADIARRARRDNSTRQGDACTHDGGAARTDDEPALDEPGDE